MMHKHSRPHQQKNLKGICDAIYLTTSANIGLAAVLYACGKAPERLWELRLGGDSINSTPYVRSVETAGQNGNFYQFYRLYSNPAGNPWRRRMHAGLMH